MLVSNQQNIVAGVQASPALASKACTPSAAIFSNQLNLKTLYLGFTPLTFNL
jgi:hypothetical protein